MIDDKDLFERNRIAAARLALLAVAVLVVMLLVVPYARADNCVILSLKTAKFYMTKTQRVATAWRTELVVNPTTGLHEEKQVPTAWTTETVSMGYFTGIGEAILAMRNDAAPGIAYKIRPPSTIYAAAIPKPATQAGDCFDAFDRRLLIR